MEGHMLPLLQEFPEPTRKQLPVAVAVPEQA